ncbi:MAG: hypothetical protein KF860_08655 [Cyclobacteriaceae bacterium]|nr:hypothetical protein [Cyclobacteriaceae bacterium]
MNATLKELKNIVSKNCITIIANTHRTKPDYLKDALRLKKLIKEAETKLLANESKKDAEKLIDRLNSLANKIDHSHNLESLILFVNEDIAEYTRLPIAVEERAVVGRTFVTRDLVRAMHQETSYYVLVLSREKVRLIEATNDKVVAEVGAPFPVLNNQFDTTEWVDLSDMSRQRNLLTEFFNLVDKDVNKVRKNNPLPVLICSVEENYHAYLKIADQRNSILDIFLNKNRIEKKNHAIVSEAWKIVQEHIIKKNNARKVELKKAVSANQFLSDTNEIWKAIAQGKIQTLFIEQGLFQPAVMKDGVITYVSDSERNNKEVIEDIYDEMIDRNMGFGGDVVFLPKGELKKFNGFGAITQH